MLYVRDLSDLVGWVYVVACPPRVDIGVGFLVSLNFSFLSLTLSLSFLPLVPVLGTAQQLTTHPPHPRTIVLPLSSTGAWTRSNASGIAERTLGDGRLTYPTLTSFTEYLAL